MSVSFSVIAAVDEKFGIAKEGNIPWRLSADMKHFKEITTAAPSNVVVMGRKTWDSLPPRFKPLPGRINAVITAHQGLPLPDGVLRPASLDEALDMAGDISPKAADIFVIGGGQVYAQALRHPSCQKIYLTHVLGDFHCDAFFPQDLSRFKRISQTPILLENNVKFSFSEYIAR